MRRIRRIEKKFRRSAGKPHSEWLVRFALLAPECQKYWQRRRKRTRKVRLPANFSVIENPTETISSIFEVVGACLAPRLGRIVVDATNVARADHGASSVLAAVLREARKSIIATLYTAGKSNPLLQLMRAETFDVLPPVDKSQVGCSGLYYPLRRGAGAAPQHDLSSEKELVATEVSDYIQDSLRQYSHQLNDSSAASLASFVGEVLDNAERHSGDPHWWIAAYSAAPSGTEGQRFGLCQITLFNLGRTVADSMKTCPEGEVRAAVEGLVAKCTHSPNQWGAQLSRDSVWTLAALQEGISSQLEDEGTGMTHLIQFFQILAMGKVRGEYKRGDDRALPPREMRLAIISGATRILIDGRYYPTRKLQMGRKRATIAFNPRNELSRPPDPACVRDLNVCFPGTLITIRFRFDQANLEKLHGP